MSRMVKQSQAWPGSVAMKALASFVQEAWPTSIRRRAWERKQGPLHTCGGTWCRPGPCFSAGWEHRPRHPPGGGLAGEGAVPQPQAASLHLHLHLHPSTQLSSQAESAPPEVRAPSGRRAQQKSGKAPSEEEAFQPCAEEWRREGGGRACRREQLDRSMGPNHKEPGMPGYGQLPFGCTERNQLKEAHTMEKSTEQLQAQQDPGPHTMNSEMCPLYWSPGTRWSQQCHSTSSGTPGKITSKCRRNSGVAPEAPVQIRLIPVQSLWPRVEGSEGDVVPGGRCALGWGSLAAHQEVITGPGWAQKCLGEAGPTQPGAQGASSQLLLAIAGRHAPDIEHLRHGHPEQPRPTAHQAHRRRAGPSAPPGWGSILSLPGHPDPAPGAHSRLLSRGGWPPRWGGKPQSGWALLLQAWGRQQGWGWSWAWGKGRYVPSMSW